MGILRLVRCLLAAGVEGNSMSEIRILSASQVDMYRTCSLKWHYRHREHLPEKSRSGALVLGSSVDVAVKTGIHRVRGGEATVATLRPADLLREAWDAEVRSQPALPVLWNEKGEAAAFKTAEALTVGYFRLPDIEARIARIESLDLRFELAVVDPWTGRPVPGLALQGILDVVERIEGGRLRALDLKTSASRAGWGSEDLVWHLQGSIYAWALRQLHGDRASDSVGFTVGLKLKDPIWEDRSVILGEPAQRRALATVLSAARAMEVSPPFPQPSWACPTCPWAQPCARWQDSVAAQVRRDVFAA
jgi:hypothetical protein